MCKKHRIVRHKLAVVRKKVIIVRYKLAVARETKFSFLLQGKKTKHMECKHTILRKNDRIVRHKVENLNFDLFMWVFCVRIVRDKVRGKNSELRENLEKSELLLFGLIPWWDKKIYCEM